MKILSLLTGILAVLASCNSQKKTEAGNPDSTNYYFDHMYKTVPLTTDLGKLTDRGTIVEGS